MLTTPVGDYRLSTDTGGLVVNLFTSVNDLNLSTDAINYKLQASKFDYNMLTIFERTLWGIPTTESGFLLREESQGFIFQNFVIINPGSFQSSSTLTPLVQKVVGQSFTGASGLLSRVDFYLTRLSGVNTGTLTAEL